jgi:hypothetical protein
MLPKQAKPHDGTALAKPAAMKLTRLAFPASSLLLLLGACGDDSGGADPAAVKSRLEATLPRVMDNVERAITGVEDAPSMAALSSSLQALDRSLALPFALAPEGEAPLARIARATGVGGGKADETDAEVDDAIGELAEMVFNPASYEGDGVYRIRGVDVCGAELDSPEADDDCAEMVDRLQLRVRATEAGDGLDLALLVGPDRDEPLAAELRSDRLTLAADLAEARAALVFASSLSDEAIALPEVMEGVLATTVQVEGDAHVRFELAARSAVRVSADTSDGPIAFATAAGVPFAVELDGIAHSIGAELAIARTTLTAPWITVNPESLVTSGTFNFALDGLSARATVAEGDEALTISGIALGAAPMTASLDDTVLFSLGLANPFALTITPTTDGLATFAFDPGFDLSALFHFAPLAAAGEAIESFLMDETYRVAFDGTGPAAQPIDASETFAGGLAVLGGQLSISSTAAAAPVVVPTGRCLVGDPVTDGEHPILGALAVADCP